MTGRPFGRATTVLRAGLAARGRRALLTPVLALGAGACFATSTDVQLLQSDIGTLRAEQSQRDSVRSAQLDRVIASVAAVGDSLRLTSSRLSQFQGDVRGELFSLGQQLIQIQELTGQSQRRLQELRAGLEERAQSVVPAAPATAPAGAGAPAAAPGQPIASVSPVGPPPAGAGAPGPNQLFQIALDQLRRGSAAAARTGFQDLLRQYPTSDLAPDAQFYIGESWSAAGSAGTADSVYQVVVQRYPSSPRAPTALYKHALILLQQGRVTEGRAALQEVVTRYPRSDEAELARERLRGAR